MTKPSILFAAAALAALGPVGLAAAETATLQSSYRADGTWQELEDGQMTWSGVFWLFSFNEAGDGFGHRQAWHCPATSLVTEGTARFAGVCVKTDADGDKLFSTWQGVSPPGEPFAGHEIYDGGTGKYEGVSGELDFTCYSIGPDEQGYCLHQVTYTLP